MIELAISRILKTSNVHLAMLIKTIKRVDDVGKSMYENPFIQQLYF